MNRKCATAIRNPSPELPPEVEIWYKCAYLCNFIFGYRVGFSGLADRIALFPVRSNPTETAANSHIGKYRIAISPQRVTNLVIYFTFGSMVGFSRSADRLAPFAFRSNPRWRTIAILQKFQKAISP